MRPPRPWSLAPQLPTPQSHPAACAARQLQAHLTMRGSQQAGGSTRLHALQLLQALGVHRVHAALGAVLRGCAREHRGGAARGGVAARARVARTVSASVSTISADSKCCRFMSRSASRRSAITRLRFSGGVPEPNGAAAAGDASGQPREPLRAKKTAAARVGLTVTGRGIGSVGCCHAAAAPPRGWRVCLDAWRRGRARGGAHHAIPGTLWRAVASRRVRHC